MTTMSDRHSSHGNSPRGNHTPYTPSYQGPEGPPYQYLRPEDVYRLEREGSYFGQSAYSQPPSRHGSETQSPRHSTIRSPGQHSSARSYSGDPQQQCSQGSLSRFSSGDDPYAPASRWVTPPDNPSPSSRHSPHSRDSAGHSPRDRVEGSARHSSGGSSPDKGKGKAKEEKRHSGGKSSSRGKHGDNDRGRGGRGGAGGAIGPSSPNLVSGVFIRY